MRPAARVAILLFLVALITVFMFQNVVSNLALVLVLLFILAYIAYSSYQRRYFNSDEFHSLIAPLEQYVDDCNALNSHIDSLKRNYLRASQTDYGAATLNDNSNWNYRRSEYSKHRDEWDVLNCSRDLCNNARQKPFKYVCKYFKIDESEKTLRRLEKMLNNYEAVEEGKRDLKNTRLDIIEDVKSKLPWLIRRFTSEKRLSRELSIEPIDFSDTYYPRFLFQYVSSGGNASLDCEVILDIDNLNRFIKYLAKRINWQQSVAGQRALMTSQLRREILERDSYTCQRCGANVYEEPNLLLEVDHIIPLSKGGITSRDNLQTLCWRCNRSKGSKIN